MAAQEKLETSSDHRGESGEILSLLKKTGKRSRSSISTPKRPSNNSPQDATIESSSADNSNSRKSQPAVVKQANKKPQKPRRRVATMAQRRAANIRERRRMFNLNSAFDRLRKKVPSFAYEKRLSRIETLKLAIMYIRFMDDLVNDDAYAEKYKQLTSNVSASNINSGSYMSLYGHCESLSPIPVQSQQQQQSLSAIQGPPNQATPNQASHPVFACKQVSATHSNYMIGHEPVALELIDQGPSAIKFGSKIHQHNVLGARRSSPSGSLACCSSSPASSPTLNTCHSSSTTFSESPSASPMVQLHSRASPLSAHLHHQQQHHSYYARQQSYPISVDLEQNSKLHYYEVGHSKDAYCRASHDASYACDVSAYSRAHSGPHQSSPYEHPMNQIHQPAAQSQHNGGPKQVEHQTIQATY